MRKLSKILSVILTIAITVTMTCSYSFADVSEEKDKLGDLNQQKNEAEQEKQELEASKAEAQAYIDEVDKKLTTLATEMYETSQELEKTQDKIATTQKKLKEAEASITVQYDEMKLRIKYMYENGDSQMMDLLLNSGSFTEFLNKAEYITELSQYDRKMLNKLKDTKKEIADAKSTLETEEKNLVAMQQRQETDKASLENLSASKQQELAQYEELISHNEDTANALEAEIRAQEQRVASAEQESIEVAEQQSREAASIEASRAAAAAAAASEHQTAAPSVPTPTPAPSHNATVSGYTWPLPGSTYVSSDFGYRSDPFTGGTEYHSGIDLPAPSGTPIVAATSGTVEWANYSSSAGNWIGINHGNGVYTIYMHMSALLVSAGTSVGAGQTIGLVGTTGSSTANHLHFSVRKNGAYVSPWDYVGN